MTQVSRVAIVLGSSANALAELEAARALAPGAPVICVNDALRTCPEKASAFVTLHPEKAERFLKGIETEGLPLFTMEAPAYSSGWIVRREKWNGTSGLYGVQVALEAMGFAGVIVAGCPIDHAHGTAYKTQKKKWAGGNESRYRSGWNGALPTIRDRVRSMSGFTQALLGAPDADWIAGLSDAPPAPPLELPTQAAPYVKPRRRTLNQILADKKAGR